jgi:hypothetical protein
VNIQPLSDLHRESNPNFMAPQPFDYQYILNNFEPVSHLRNSAHQIYTAKGAEQ